MAILNEYDSPFGRRSDMLMIGGRNDELANIEFKKATQSKSIRINSCIINYINLMTETTANAILYYDFIERQGYLAQLFVYQDVCVYQKLQSIPIPDNMIKLELFRSSLKLMFVWESHTINLSNNITLANLNREHTTSPPRSPSLNAQPVQMYLSPSNDKKRSRSVFEE
ncbi:uncharacterized protein B0P05DRAFT_577352 [Gilbertella persicaria]|uniref:uncharacterized protein n=1 Tax=Gilbertella persicaria TaxID=101096 RepID=UPI00221F764F|nr:uncharacterized protein B0P05DRAFT_577352 [Gilbertella persicaria]KAI8091294.1 hypothetical protein B0P05DRAFT_577352 [Gilbertella persicaria]